MEFDKPVVSPNDLKVVMQAYPFGEISAGINMGGIPNTTYKIIAQNRLLAVRIYSRGQSSLEHIEFELKVLEHLRIQGFRAPRPVKGRNGEFLQRWQGYWVCASDFIPGVTADSVTLTPNLCFQIGELIYDLQYAISSFDDAEVPKNEIFFKRAEQAVMSLESSLKKRGWAMDIENVHKQFEQAMNQFKIYEAFLTNTVLHGDAWPPNILVNEGTIVGLIDFDDCSYGPNIFDLIIPLMECGMYSGVIVDEAILSELLRGYIHKRQTLSDIEKLLILPGMEICCAMWLVYNIVQASASEAKVYLNRLDMLNNSFDRKRLSKIISRSFTYAETSLA